MTVTIIGKNYTNIVSLPEKAKGQFWLYENLGSHNERLVNIEGLNDAWIMKSTRKVKILDEKINTVKSVTVAENGIYKLRKSTGEIVYIFVEPSTDDRQIFKKYLVNGDMTITIGSVDRSDVFYNDYKKIDSEKIVSENHASIRYQGQKWEIKDCNSFLGTFVNGKRITQTELNIGDTIFIMGLKIIIGKNIIAFNNPDGTVKISSKLREYISPKTLVGDDGSEYEMEEKEYFYRSPRFKRDIETAIFKVDSPPQSPVTEEMPWILVMGSSLAMGLMSLITLVNAIVNHNIMSMVMGISMLLGTVLLPIITKNYEKKRRFEKEKLRQEKYKKYLCDISNEIKKACHLQEEILNENYITVGECENRISGRQRNLWERSSTQNDFLVVRLGKGNGVLDSEMKYSERRFSIEEDNLQDELYNLCESEKVLHNIPITVSLYEKHISGVIGNWDQVVEFAKCLIIQLSALYSYDEVKFVFLFDEKEKNFEFVKWLPHVWSDDGRFRFIATNIDEVKEVSAYFKRVIETRENVSSTDKNEIKPYYIFFSLSKALSDRAEVLKKVLSKKENIHMSIVTFCDELRKLPKECSAIIGLRGTSGKMFDQNDISGRSIKFTPETNLAQDPLKLSISLANTTLDTSANNFQLPSMITFLELFGVGKVEHLNVLTRWKENDPTKSLQAAVGVDTYGEKFMLDLHEKFHGPHGLVAGMTGSGKSEFIITYILSLAVNYHPEEVAFVLIDYKGGGMANSFKNLPHTAGVITNLDGSAIKRSLVSIESELKRRQAIFSETSEKVGVSNIDIYKYQKLYREGKVTEPLQHLFIISDEFAELKTQQSEFMTQLVSAARIGRSLGVHLILATQKPSGVVDDQIWSNSKFRVCLKVQERADSMEMLKRHEAAELTDTGRFYLQVGYNELFELGQSAWSGAPYCPSDHVVKEKDNSVVVIDTNGHAIKQVKIDKNRFIPDKAKKQLDIITEYLRGVADDEGIKIKPLWLEPIPGEIILDCVKEKYKVTEERFVLNPIIGEYDDPAHQRHCALTLPLTQEGNVIIYGAAGAGKTTFLNAMLYSLIKDHTPDEVNLYILDFSSGTLGAFSQAPHVGDVISSEDAEKVSNLFKMLNAELKKRKKLFADYGGDFASYIHSSGSILPSIVVAVNNFDVFSETYEEKEGAISHLSREGTKYGIYFVLTALGTNSVRFRLQQNFKQLLALQLNDETEYSSVVGKTDGLLPAKFKGRGLVKRDELYEFQLANLIKDKTPFDFIKSACKEISQKWNGATARKVPILPDQVNVEFLSEYIDTKKKLNIPVGVEKNSLNVHHYPFGSSYISVIMSSGSEYQEFVSSLTELIGESIEVDTIVFDVPKMIEKVKGTISLFGNADDCEKQIKNLYDLLLQRNMTYANALKSGNKALDFKPLLVVINSLSMLMSCLSENGNEALDAILWKGAKEYNVNIIVADQLKNLSPISYRKWYQENVSRSDGLWIGGGFAQQHQMKASKTTNEMHEDITEEYGYSLIGGKCVKLKLLRNKVEEA